MALRLDGKTGEGGWAMMLDVECLIFRWKGEKKREEVFLKTLRFRRNVLFLKMVAIVFGSVTLSVPFLEKIKS